MIVRRPIPLRWTEEAEAEQVCALAALEREPHSGAARVVGVAIRSSLPGRRPALLSRLLSLFGEPQPQINRDGGPGSGL